MATRTYRIWNNTDLRDRPIYTTSRRQAERLWRSVRPGPQAGNAYAASFTSVCPRCGGVQDEEAPFVTCDCPRPMRRSW